MSEREGTPVRRLHALRPDSDTSESAETILPGSPRVGALDALLREVDGLRHTLETDLGLAATALEAGAAGTAVDLLDGDRDSLARFEGRALGHLSELSAMTSSGRRRRLRLSATPFVAAAALVGFLLGVVPGAVSGSDTGTLTTNLTANVAANSSLDRLQDFAATGNVSQVRAAATTLHAQLLAAVAQAGSDPEAAQHALLLLSYERDAIVQSGDSAALRDVLMLSAALTTKIRNALPATLRKNVPSAPQIAVATVSPSPAPKPTKASPSPSPSAAPKPKPTSSPSPQPSSSPDGPGVLPSGNPAAGH